MALMRCPECSREVSDKATACPGCGYPLKASRTGPQAEFTWAGTLSRLGFWALLIVGSIALVQFASGRRQEAMEISYTQFTEQLDAGNIAAVEVTEGQRVDGTFRRSLTAGGRAAQHFTTLMPFASSEGWVAALREKGVDVRAREEKQSFGVFLFSFLPYLFILGIIIFMLRRRSGESTH